MLRLEIMGEESVTSIHLYDEFNVNLLFDRSIHRPMCTHMGQVRATVDLQFFYSASGGEMKNAVFCDQITF